MRLMHIEKFGVAEADNDDLLLDCFEDHEAYVAALEHRKFLIVGRKAQERPQYFESWYQIRNGIIFVTVIPSRIILGFITTSRRSLVFQKPSATDTAGNT
jgi:hypothetical protein